MANRWATPWCTSSAGGKAVDIRHCTFGCATTVGASTMAAAAVAATIPPAFAMNLRRSLTMASLPHHELPVGAFGHAIPRADYRLEPREGRVHLLGHGRLLGLLANDFHRELLELAKHGHGKLGHLDLALEVRLEALERDAILGLIGGKPGKLDGARGLIQDPPEVGGQGLVGLFVERELAHGAGLMPAGVVVVASGVVEVQLHVVVRSHPLGRIDHAPLEIGEDPGSGDENRRATRLPKHLVAEARADSHLEALEVGRRVDLLSDHPAIWGEKAGPWRGTRLKAA